MERGKSIIEEALQAMKQIELLLSYCGIHIQFNQPKSIQTDEDLREEKLKFELMRVENLPVPERRQAIMDRLKSSEIN
jgi:hypothetical protein